MGFMDFFFMNKGIPFKESEVCEFKTGSKE